MVVPPEIAAFVPVKKSSAVFTPLSENYGKNRCVCVSMPPGIAYFPFASIILAFGFGTN